MQNTAVFLCFIIIALIVAVKMRSFCGAVMIAALALVDGEFRFLEAVLVLSAVLDIVRNIYVKMRTKTSITYFTPVFIILCMVFTVFLTFYLKTKGTDLFAQAENTMSVYSILNLSVFVIGWVILCATLAFSWLMNLNCVAAKHSDMVLLKCKFYKKSKNPFVYAVEGVMNGKTYYFKTSKKIYSEFRGSERLKLKTAKSFLGVIYVSKVEKLD